MTASQTGVGAGEHPGELDDPRCVVEGHHPAARDGAVVGLDDEQMAVGEGGHLGKVGHHHDLVAAGQPGQPAPDLHGGSAADAGVDLVEDHQRDRVGAGEDDLDGQHDPRELTAGRALLQRPRRRAGVGHQQHLDLVDAVDRRGERAAAHRQAVRDLALADLRGDLSVRHGQGGQLRRDRGAEPQRRRGARRGQLGGQLAERLLECGVLLLQGGDAVVGAVELEQSVGRGDRPRQHRVDVLRTVAPHQGGEHGDAVLGDRQADRVGVDRGEVGRELARDIGQQVARLLEPGLEAGQLGVVPGGGLQRPAGGDDQLQRVARLGGRLVTGEGDLGDGCRRPQVVGVGEALDLGDQRRALPLLRGRGLDLGQSEPEQLGLPHPLGGLTAQLLQGRPDVAPLRPAGREALPQGEHRRAGEAVQGRALLGRLEQALLVALAVDGDDVLGQLAEHADGDAATAEVGA